MRKRKAQEHNLINSNESALDTDDTTNNIDFDEMKYIYYKYLTDTKRLSFKELVYPILQEYALLTDQYHAFTKMFSPIMIIQQDSLENSVDVPNVHSYGFGYDNTVVTEQIESAVQRTKTVCRSCGSTETNENIETGTIDCASCGLELKRQLCHGPETRGCTGEDGKGAEVARCLSSGNSLIHGSTTDGTRMLPFNSKVKGQYWNFQNNSNVTRDNTTKKTLKGIDSKCKTLGVTNEIARFAKELYMISTKSTHQKGPTKGKPKGRREQNDRSMCAACVYKAANLKKEPIGLKKVSNLYNIEKKGLTKSKRLLDNILNSDVNGEYCHLNDQNDTDTYISYNCKRLDIDYKYEKEALIVCKNSIALTLVVCHNPQSISAGVIAAVCHTHTLNIRKKEIADSHERSESTVIKVSDKILNLYEILVSDEATAMTMAHFGIYNKHTDPTFDEE